MTVVIALVGLAVVNVPMLTKMGIVAAATVAIAVPIALTMIPALLGYAGRKIQPAGEKGKLFGGKKAKGHAEAKPNMGTRWASFVTRRPAAVLLLGVVGLGVVALPATHLRLGLGDGGNQPTSTTQRRAYDLLSEGFGPGFNGPLMVVVDAKASDDPEGAATMVTDDIKGLKDVVTVAPAMFTGDIRKPLTHSTPHVPRPKHRPYEQHSGPWQERTSPKRSFLRYHPPGSLRPKPILQLSAP